jgi:hypothetical protein
LHHQTLTFAIRYFNTVTGVRRPLGARSPAALYNPTTVNLPAEYVGKYFYAEFCSGWIRRFDPGTGTAAAFAAGIANPVDLIVTADGSLYYLARGAGAVFRVRFNAPTNTFGDVTGQITNSSDGPRYQAR